MNDQELTIKAIEAAIGRPLSAAERLQACNACGDLLTTLNIDRLAVPREGGHGGFFRERTGRLFGYDVEKHADPASPIGYYLHGPRVTYKLMRRVGRPSSLYVLNSKGHVSNIKGNYNFSDESGTLRAMTT